MLIEIKNNELLYKSCHVSYDWLSQIEGLCLLAYCAILNGSTDICIIGLLNSVFIKKKTKKMDCGLCLPGK
jgi:hypothetical protein